jgi:hypothetical protein
MAVRKPDPQAWAFALDLVGGDVDLLEVREDGTVWVLNEPRPKPRRRTARTRTPLPEPAPAADPIFEDAGDDGTALRAHLFPPNTTRPVLLLELDRVRAGRATHLVERFADFALCGTALTGPWSPGTSVTCPTCMTILPPEAD